VELASQDQLLRLADSLERGNPRHAGRPRKEALLRRTNVKLLTRSAAPIATAPNSKGHYCKCGHCRICLQNAEWDAKFNQKFGESMKDYYSGMRLTRQASWWSEL
jgi:hypothetical protein